MPQLVRLHAREILDSRGFPTVEAEATLDDGSSARASVPSGASTGSHEAHELRDQDPQRFQGKGVSQAVAYINDELAPALLNNDVSDQAAIDSELVLRDGSPDLSRFGANAVLAVSLAIAKAVAVSQKLPLYRYIAHLYQTIDPAFTFAGTVPVPMFNILNGGAHTHWQSTDFQEFMVVPVGATSIAQGLEWGSEIYHQLQTLLQDKKLSTLVGDEGGFAPSLKSNEEAMELILAAVSKAGLNTTSQIKISVDAATSELYKNGHYVLPSTSQELSTTDMIAFWQQWLNQYPLLSIEDGLAEDDWDGWQQLSSHLNSKVLVVGDDLLVTNTERIQKAIQLQACNTLLMKVNQIGTLTESLQAVALARQAGWKIIVSHRSGETEDTAIADIAVGIGAEFVKMGAPARSERTAKYNQLLRIEEELAHS